MNHLNNENIIYPIFPYINLEKNNNIYEPREDTFFFIEALNKEKNFLYNLKPKICLEIGY